MALDEVKPWGRSLSEYRAMFALSDEDLCLRILDCAGGPASFNAEWTERGGAVVSGAAALLLSADPTLSPGVTTAKASHVEELRVAAK